MEKIDQGKKNGGAQVAISNRLVRTSIIEKLTFKSGIVSPYIHLALEGEKDAEAPNFQALLLNILEWPFEPAPAPLLLLREPHPHGDRSGPPEADQPTHAGASREPTGKHTGNQPS